MFRNKNKKSDRADWSHRIQGSHTQMTVSLQIHTLTYLDSNITALLVEKGPLPGRQAIV
jgi:hypothetical protein